MRFLTKAIENYYWKNYRSTWTTYKNMTGIEEMETMRNWISKRQAIQQTKSELFFIYTITRKLKKLKGAIAEVGTYQGGTAKVIAETEKSKEIHLFDTFDGFPYTSGGYTKGFWKADVEKVRECFAGSNNVFIHKGVFPEQTSASVKDKKFSLVHLDADQYKTTIKSLEFFYPRMQTGGIMIFHDYTYLPDIKKAINEFFENKPETILNSTGCQAYVQILGEDEVL